MFVHCHSIVFMFETRVLYIVAESPHFRERKKEIVLMRKNDDSFPSRGKSVESLIVKYDRLWYTFLSTWVFFYIQISSILFFVCFYFETFCSRLMQYWAIPGAVNLPTPKVMSHISIHWFSLLLKETEGNTQNAFRFLDMLSCNVWAFLF